MRGCLSHQHAAQERGEEQAAGPEADKAGPVIDDGLHVSEMPLETKLWWDLLCTDLPVIDDDLCALRAEEA